MIPIRFVPPTEDTTCTDMGDGKYTFTHTDGSVCVIIVTKEVDGVSIHMEKGGEFNEDSLAEFMGWVINRIIPKL